jgi:hypothetical protein
MSSARLDARTSNARGFGKTDVDDLFRNPARAVDLFTLRPRNLLVIERRIEI